MGYFQMKGNKKNKGKATKPVAKKRIARVNDEIIFYQKSTNLLVSKKGFKKFLKNILSEKQKGFVRISNNASLMIQEVAEEYILNLFKKSYANTRGASRKTLLPRDLRKDEF